MKTTHTGNNISMERHVYTIPVNEFDNYKHLLKLPDNALLTFWYENKKEEKDKKNEWKNEWGKIAGIWSDYDNIEEEFQKIRSSFNNRIS